MGTIGAINPLQENASDVSHVPGIFDEFLHYKHQYISIDNERYVRYIYGIILFSC